MMMVGRLLLLSGVLLFWNVNAFSPIAPFQQKAATTKTILFEKHYIPKEKDLDFEINDFTGEMLYQAFGWKKVKKLKRKLKARARKERMAKESLVKKDENRARHTAATKRNAKDPVKLVLAGAPASGKGTQCNILAQRYNVVHLSTGDMLRAAVADETDIGKQAKEFMDAGKLVPDDVVIGIVKDRVAQEDCQKNGWLLDGFPRTESQAKAMTEAGIVPDCFLFLKVPDEDLVERVVGRRMDPETGAIYHLTFNPPTSPEVEARLVQRSDDTEEKVAVRLQEFNTNIGAVKACFDESICVDVDGTLEPLQVAHGLGQAITSTVKLPESFKQQNRRAKAVSAARATAEASPDEAPVKKQQLSSFMAKLLSLSEEDAMAYEAEQEQALLAQFACSPEEIISVAE